MFYKFLTNYKKKNIELKSTVIIRKKERYIFSFYQFLIHHY